MNKSDRKAIEKIREQLEDLQTQIEAFSSQLQELADAEREKFDNMPESLQQGEKGEVFDTAASALADAAQSCGDGNVKEALENLDSIE